MNIEHNKPLKNKHTRSTTMTKVKAKHIHFVLYLKIQSINMENDPLKIRSRWGNKTRP